MRHIFKLPLSQVFVIFAFLLISTQSLAVEDSVDYHQNSQEDYDTEDAALNKPSEAIPNTKALIDTDTITNLESESNSTPSLTITPENSTSDPSTVTTTVTETSPPEETSETPTNDTTGPSKKPTEDTTIPAEIPTDSTEEPSPTDEGSSSSTNEDSNTTEAESTSVTDENTTDDGVTDDEGVTDDDRVTDEDGLTSSEPSILPLPQDGSVPTWSIVTISILISFAAIFTGLYYLRLYLIKKRRDDQKRLLRGSVSSEGFFYGDGSGSMHSNRFHDSI